VNKKLFFFFKKKKLLTKDFNKERPRNSIVVVNAVIITFLLPRGMDHGGRGMAHACLGFTKVK
jgi:hypothetical protein